MDILRRSRSEVTESLSSSSGRELDEEREESVGEGGGAVGKTGFVCDATRSWFWETPVQLAESLRLLWWRWGAGRDSRFVIEGRCLEARGSVGAMTDEFLPGARWRGYWPSLWWRVNEPRERLRWLSVGTVIGTWEGSRVSSIREGTWTVGVKRRICKLHSSGSAVYLMLACSEPADDKSRHQRSRPRA